MYSILCNTLTKLFERFDNVIFMLSYQATIAVMTFSCALSFAPNYIRTVIHWRSTLTTQNI